jgi:hypothetical protein
MNARTSALMIAIVLSMVTAWPVHAEVPTAADFAACNMKAAEQAAADSVSASPRTDLPKDATQLPPDARPKAGGGGMAGSPSMQKDPTGSTLSSDKDPQIEGLAADRANDKVYVATYRSCMRQRGF